MKMAKKKSKNQVPSRDKEANCTPKSWPDLPLPLRSLISREPILLQNIYSKGVTKSWPTKPSKCNSSNFPSSWLQLFDHDKETVGNEPHSLNIVVKNEMSMWWWYGRRKERLQRCPELRYLGCSYGFLVIKFPSAFTKTDQYSLFYPDRIQFGWNFDSYLPEWNNKYPCLRIVFSSDPGRYLRPENKSIAMALTGISNPAFGFHIIGKRHGWIKQDCSIVDPHCSNPCEKQHFMRFTNAIGFKGKFYAVSLHGTLVVIENKNGDIGIAGLCKQRAVPSVSSKHYRECLVESDGKILLVFLVSKKSVRVVDDVEVYKINDANLTLTKLDSLGDTTLFLGANCCMAISARRLLGCKRNSIYFTHSSVDDWWVYDLETGTISPGWDDSSSMNSQFGFDPELVE